MPQEVHATEKERRRRGESWYGGAWEEKVELGPLLTRGRPVIGKTAESILQERKRARWLAEKQVIGEVETREGNQKRPLLGELIGQSRNGRPDCGDRIRKHVSMEIVCGAVTRERDGRRRGVAVGEGEFEPIWKASTETGSDKEIVRRGGKQGGQRG